MTSKKDLYTSHAGSFLLGVGATSLFFLGATAPTQDIGSFSLEERLLSGSVVLSDVRTDDFMELAQDDPIAISRRASYALYVPTEASFFATIPTTTPTTTPATSTEEVSEEVVIVASEQEKIETTEESEPVDTNLIESVIAQAQAQLEALTDSEDEEVVSEPEERKLPDGVYQLANGDYVDKNGDKISGDPFAYNYKPPNEEEKFTTPGGVVMDRFGVIHHRPDVIDETKVLIPPTVIEEGVLPATTTIHIPRFILAAINQNPFLTCTQLFLFGNDKLLCELYKTNADDYEWVRVDDPEDD